MADERPGAHLAAAPQQYVPPGAPPYAAPYPPPARLHEYRSTAGLAPWLIALAGVSMVLNVAQAVLRVVGANILVVLAFVLAPVALAIAVVGLVWSYRVAANADAFGARDRGLPTVMAVLGWMIPVANLALPYFVFRDIWKASDPRVPTEAWRRAPVPGWFHAWWLSYALNGVLGLVATVFGFYIGIRQGLQRAAEGTTAPPASPFAPPPTNDFLTIIGLIGAAAYFVAYLFFVRLVRELKVRQDEKAAIIARAVPQQPEWRPAPMH